MFHTRKLKPDRSIGPWIFPLGAILLFGLTSLIFSVPASFVVLAICFLLGALYGLYILILSGNLWYLVVIAYNIFIAAMLYLARIYVIAEWNPRREWALAYFTGLIFFGVLLVYLMVTKRIKWRGREIFEMAAAPVEETGNGYTPRPRPVGRVDFSKQEILAFARFCARHLIAVIYVSPRQVTFVPVKMGDEYSFMFRPGTVHQEMTWISFDFDGDVSVHIAQKDHLDFMEPLSFDKLCESLGQLFIEFAEMHRRGEGVRIIDRMDALRISIFS